MFDKLKLPGNILIGTVTILIIGSTQLWVNFVKLGRGVRYQTLKPELWSSLGMVIAGSALLLITLVVAIWQHYRH
ncbi:hypothetical protein [Lactiplantibacillus mudanjiangensis]|uniref:Uncharacterized protein n=1 Tax=Lactiplantibacillus mudanjiangensis TaxID=1296538 RepID=A0A660E7Z8_9LACO|nr:hypothetical protein [Lactiplantibacillus mudanjiangensis]VDG21134.1 hypothetical protein MUDAN_BIHEEGNE_02766 [Lactiplantibacillus mudanjiangensis]VDG22930.1 hypothetical protein MUDAN_IGPPGNFN_00466 [Lactiplantibacillus mudanjiangensis]VDG29211.1 hypothetical protein MUDAN_MDHGFNIF_00892 [Lactiplantibacillus mudanjiangensis]VDG31738.1 hypothetical protein MUDAN_DOGOELCO_01028 [Lactiplantibacillus mudanjiangensis]